MQPPVGVAALSWGRRCTTIATSHTQTMAQERHDSVARQGERTRVKLPKKIVICCDGRWGKLP